MAVKLIYKDIALGADEDATVTTSAAESFSDTAALPFGVDAPAVATCEPNGWGLTHDYGVRDKQPFAFWSTDRSGVDCTFSTPPTITFTFSNQYTATGLTVRFSPAAMDYCTQITATWYQGGTVKHSGTYYPDTPNYVIADTVEAFDKIILAFEKTSLPGKRLKVEKVTMGVIREFAGDELKSAGFIHEISLISDTVPTNVLDAAFHSKENVDYVFQRKQPVEGYNGEELLGVYYIESGKRKGASDYEISCSDLIGVWDIEEYTGGIWIEDTPLTDILAEIYGGVTMFEIAPEYASSTLRGYIEPGTKRSALQQIAFALGAVADTSGTSKVKLYPPVMTGTGDTIPAKRTYTGGVVNVSDKVTEVTVTAYIIFDERPGENQESIEFNGVKYRYYTDTKHAYNPDVVSTDLQNVVKFTGAYLVNLSNAQTLADNIMTYYMRREKYTAKHELSGQMPGERVTATLPWNETASGNLTKMSISVTGLTVSDSEILLD